MSFTRASYLLACLSLVACHSNQKVKTTIKKEQRFDPFSIKKIASDNFVISLNYNKKNISCEAPCKVDRSRSFLKLSNMNRDILYNRSGKIIANINNESGQIKITDSFAKVFDGQNTALYSGASGEQILKILNPPTNLKITKSYALLESLSGELKIWNHVGKLIDTQKVQKGNYKSYISDHFAGYTINYKKLVMYGLNGQKLANYSFTNKRPMRVTLNNNFMYYSIGKSIGALHSIKGQLMSFAGRPSQAIYMTNKVAGFADISESASFWRSNGQHILSLTQEPGLEVSQYNDTIEYKTSRSHRYKKIN